MKKIDISKINDIYRKMQNWQNDLTSWQQTKNSQKKKAQREKLFSQLKDINQAFLQITNQGMSTLGKSKQYLIDENPSIPDPETTVISNQTSQQLKTDQQIEKLKQANANLEKITKEFRAILDRANHHDSDASDSTPDLYNNF